MPKAGPLQVAVIGAGPIGLEAALAARNSGFAVNIYDRAGIAENVRRWGHVRMFSPFGLNTTPLGLQTILSEKPGRTLPAPQDVITGREYRDCYLVPLGESELLLESLALEQTVVQVGRSDRGKKTDADPPGPFRLLIQDARGQERIDQADVILDCSGTAAMPNWLGDGNIPAIGERAARAHIATGLEDILGERKGYYAGRSIALIGHGYSAATTMCNLAILAEEHPSTWVVWLSRGPRGQPLPRIPNDPFRERDRLAARANSLATRCDGNLEFHPQTVLDEVTCHGADRGFRIAGRTNGKSVSWEVERVIAAVGSRAERNLTAMLAVDEPAGTSQTREAGYWILGSKSWGHDSSFLLRQGYEEVSRVLAALNGLGRGERIHRRAA